MKRTKKKRDHAGELMDGVAAMKAHREGKITLLSYKVESASIPRVESSAKAVLVRTERHG